MNLLGQILLVCLAIAALQWLMAVAAVVLILLLIAGLIFRTGTTVTLLVMLLLFKCLEVHPIGTLSIAGALWGAIRLADWIRKCRPVNPAVPTLLLPPPDFERPGD